MGADRKTCHCESPSLHARGLEEAIWEHVGGFLARPGLAVRELRQQLAAEGVEGQTAEDDLRRLEKRRGGLAEVRRRVLSQYGAGNFSDDEVRQEVASLDAEWAILDWEREEKRSAKAHAASASLQLDWAGRLLGELRGQLLEGKLSFEKKRRFVEALVGGITITPEGRPEPNSASMAISSGRASTPGRGQLRRSRTTIRAPVQISTAPEHETGVPGECRALWGKTSRNFQVLALRPRCNPAKLGIDT
jgi:hypothetical protein